MLKRHRCFTVVYAVLFTLALVAVNQSWPKVVHAVKPCMCLLSLVFLCLSTKLAGRFHQRIFTGLVFALAGDTLLMLIPYNPSYLMLGIGAFLCCHLFYIGAFYLDFRSAPELDKVGARIAIAVCALLFPLFYLYLRPHLPVLKLPVLLCVLIGAMLTMMAVFRRKRVNQISFQLIFGGVVFLLITDALMAQVHFIGLFSRAELWISTFYLIAQYLLVTGAAERKLIYTQTPV